MLFILSNFHDAYSRLIVMSLKMGMRLYINIVCTSNRFYFTTIHLKLTLNISSILLGSFMTLYIQNNNRII